MGRHVILYRATSCCNRSPNDSAILSTRPDGYTMNEDHVKCLICVIHVFHNYYTYGSESRHLLSAIWSFGTEAIQYNPLACAACISLGDEKTPCSKNDSQANNSPQVELTKRSFGVAQHTAVQFPVEEFNFVRWPLEDIGFGGNFKTFSARPLDSAQMYTNLEERTHLAMFIYSGEKKQIQNFLKAQKSSIIVLTLFLDIKVFSKF